MKVKVSVNIDRETYEKNKNLGVNVSQACTNYLKLLNRQIEATLSQKDGFLGKRARLLHIHPFHPFPTLDCSWLFHLNPHYRSQTYSVFGGGGLNINPKPKIKT